MKNQQILGQLLPLLHRNVKGSKVIVQEFQESCHLGLLSGHNGSASIVDSRSDGTMSSPLFQSQTPLSDKNAIPSKARLKRLISENSVYKKRSDHLLHWYGHPKVLKSYGQETLPVRCQMYITQVPSGAKEDDGDSPRGTVANGKHVNHQAFEANSRCQDGWILGRYRGTRQ